MCNGCEQYANQDYIGCEESNNPLGDISEIYANTAEKEWPNGTSSKHNLVILYYFVDRLEKPEIIEKTGYSFRHINRILASALAKILN